MITITGGTYRERCLCPDFDFKFGSGLRACHAIHALDDSVEVEFHTFCSPDNDLFLTMFEDALKIKTHNIPPKIPSGLFMIILYVPL